MATTAPANTQFSFLFDLLEKSNDGSRPNSGIIQLKTGEALFDQGDHDDRLYLLDDGLLEVSVLSVSGRKLALNQLSPGSIFGEIALFDPGPRTARIEALKPSQLRAVKQSVLLGALPDHPDLAADLLALAGQRMRWLSQQVEDQVFRSPSARLAAKLLHLADGSGSVRMSQAQLAEYVGVSREIVSKVLSHWRRSDVVSLSRGTIAILKSEDLEDIRDADFV